MILTKQQIIRIMPNSKNVVDVYLPIINKYSVQFGLTTKLRMAYWLANVAHESAEMTKTSENLNYSTQRLMEVWGSRFKSKFEAMRYAHNPSALANHVYANRMGNGDEKSGDGWRFRGRGFFGLTGRTNYKAYNAYLVQHGMSVDLTTDSGAKLIEQPVGAVKSAMWFAMKYLNMYADSGSFTAYVKKLNGGTIGLASRNTYLQRALLALG